MVDEGDGLLDGGPLVEVVTKEHGDVPAGVERLLREDGRLDDAVPGDVLHDLLKEVDLVVVEVGLVDELPDGSPGSVPVEAYGLPD